MMVALGVERTGKDPGTHVKPCMSNPRASPHAHGAKQRRPKGNFLPEDSCKPRHRGASLQRSAAGPSRDKTSAHTIPRRSGYFY